MTVHCPWCGKECRSSSTVKVHALQQFDGVHPDSKAEILKTIQSMSHRPQLKGEATEPRQETQVIEERHEKTLMERLTEGLKAEKEKGISEILGLEV